MNPKTKTVLLILFCFALGAVAGIVSDRYYVGPRTSRRPDVAQMRKEFAQRLHLDTLQMTRVDSLMDFHRKRMDDVRKLFSLERDTLRADMRKLLTPAQNKIYDDYVKEMEAREARRREGEHQSSK
ncbi:MAG TPA: hypothetical protein VI758_11530 [Bacteroidota bacterium]